MNLKHAKDCFSSEHYKLHNKKRQEHLASLGLDLSGETVLEVGAGIGDHTEFFLNRGCSIVVTEARNELLEILRDRFKGIFQISVQSLDMDKPVVKFSNKFGIVYCYGLLYHLKSPDTAIEYMANSCDGKLLLETCVSPEEKSKDGINKCTENIKDPTQSFSGFACRPTRSWIYNKLKQHFEFVYLPITQPDHPEFPLDWTNPTVPPTGLVRSVFIASRTPIKNELLVEELPLEQKRM